MEYWEEERRTASKARHALRSDDPEAIRGILQTCGPRVRDLMGGTHA
jgi:hypothetical protein